MVETFFKQPGQGLCTRPLVRTRLVRILRALRLEPLALHARRVLRKRRGTWSSGFKLDAVAHSGKNSD